MNKVDVGDTTFKRIKGMIRIRDTVRDLITYQSEDYPEEMIAKKQRELNDYYDVFLKHMVCSTVEVIPLHLEKTVRSIFYVL